MTDCKFNTAENMCSSPVIMIDCHGCMTYRRHHAGKEMDTEQARQAREAKAKKEVARILKIIESAGGGKEHG